MVDVEKDEPLSGSSFFVSQTTTTPSGTVSFTRPSMSS
ncbi:MAG: hypothetical protein K0R28_5871, partial [Paenibacillus sp.]|nr:hypothetical protein [Paenibacillus sp.]